MPTDRERMTNEMKTATMIRRIMGDISIKQARRIYKLFGCDFDNLTGSKCGLSCAEWYLAIKRDFSDLYVIKKLNGYIELSYLLDIDLNEDEDWKQMLRAYYSPQTIKKIRKYTQVPQMAEQDETKYEEPAEETWSPFEKTDWVG